MQKPASWTTEVPIAKTVLSLLTFMLLLLLVCPEVAGDKARDEDTLQEANIVLEDMLPYSKRLTAGNIVRQSDVNPTAERAPLASLLNCKAA